MTTSAAPLWMEWFHLPNATASAKVITRRASSDRSVILSQKGEAGFDQRMRPRSGEQRLRRLLPHGHIVLEKIGAGERI